MCSTVKLRRSRSTTASRSEEHTSELQSLAYLVCRLLLENRGQKSEVRGQKSEVRGQKSEVRGMFHLPVVIESAATAQMKNDKCKMKIFFYVPSPPHF